MQLDILGVPYQIRRVPELPLGIQFSGQLYARKGYILVLDSGGPPADLTETLVHELIHAVDTEFRLGISDESVGRLAKGLFAILAHNSLLAPLLWDKVPWLMPEEKEGLKGL